MVGAPDPGDLVLVEELLDEPLRLGVDLHESYVGEVDGEEHGGLPPLDQAVLEEDDQGHQGHGVEGAVAEEGPPEGRMNE